MKTKITLKFVLLVSGLCAIASADQGRTSQIASVINRLVPATVASKVNCIEDMRVEVVGDGDVGHLNLAINARADGEITQSRVPIQDIPAYSSERAAVSREVALLKSSANYRERFCAQQDNPFQKTFHSEAPNLPAMIR